MIPVRGAPVYGLVESEWKGQDYWPCADAKCTRRVQLGDVCFLDLGSNRVYCADCGKCLRYARKKAAARGEDPMSVVQG